MFAIIESEMLWRTIWCRLSRLIQAEIRQIWWWTLYQKRSMSSAGVWQAWFQFEDPLNHKVGGRDWSEWPATWWKRLFIYRMHSCTTLRLSHTFMHPFGFFINWESNLQPFRFHVPFWIPYWYGIQKSHLLYKKKGDRSITIITKIRTTWYREKPVSVSSLNFLTSKKFWPWSRGKCYPIKTTFKRIVPEVLGSHQMVRSLIRIFYYS